MVTPAQCLTKFTHVRLLFDSSCTLSTITWSKIATDRE